MNREGLNKLQLQKEQLRNSWARHQFAQKLRHRRAVVIDDDPCALLILRHYLKNFGFNKVDTFHQEFKALEFMSSHMPDIVIMDINLESSDGLKIANALPQLYGPFLPLMLISADEQNEKRIDAETVPTNTRFLAKPLEFHLFQAAVLESLGQGL